MGTDKKLISDIIKIRRTPRLRIMDFLRFLINKSPSKGKKLLDLIQFNDQKIQKLSDLLHMKKNKTDLEILNEIEEIRSKNNVLWMDVVRLCFELDPKRARLIFKEIKECDRKIQKLSNEISKSGI